VSLFKIGDNFAWLKVFETSNNTAYFDDPEEVFLISVHGNNLEWDQRNYIPSHIAIPVVISYFTKVSNWSFA